MPSEQSYKFQGPIDRAVDQVDRFVADGSSVVLDFESVTFVSVDGLEWLEELLLRANSAALKVAFVNVPPTIYKVFKVAHIESLLNACGALSLSGPVC